jgi:hypothetical protein
MLSSNDWWAVWLRLWFGVTVAPPRPARFALSIAYKVITKMGAKFKVSVHLPTPPTPSDISHHSLTLTVDGQAQAPITIPLDATDEPLGLYSSGQVLEASLCYVDAGGKAGQPRVESLTVTDTFPPPQPGEFSLVIAEKVYDDVTPTPIPTQPAA